MHLFGLTFFSGSSTQVEELLVQAGVGDSPACIATVTGEMLLAARKNPSVLHALRSCTYRIADSVSIPLLHALFLQKKPTRYTGSSMVHFIVHHQILQKKRIAVIGSDEQTVSSCNEKLEKEGSAARLIWIPTGRLQKTEHGWTEDDRIRAELEQQQPHIVFVALGGEANDRQEAWVADHWEGRSQSVGLMIGIGGALDMLAGVYPRAPLFLQRIGMEWAWRLGQQPSRWRRILRAVVFFPLLTIFDTLRGRYAP